MFQCFQRNSGVFIGFDLIWPLVSLNVHVAIGYCSILVRGIADFYRESGVFLKDLFFRNLFCLALVLVA